MLKKYAHVTLPLAAILVLAVLLIVAQASPSYQYRMSGIVSAQAPIFPDVIESHANFEAIQYLAENGYVEGYPTGFFQPNRVVNRAELAAMIIRAKDITPHSDMYRDCFSDVRKEWFARYVCYGESNLWWQGYPGSPLFKPGANVSSAEAIRMILEAYDIRLQVPLLYFMQKWDVPKDCRNLCPDILPEDSPRWWYTYFVTARMWDYIDKTPLADKIMTRGEIAEIIYRVVLDKQGLWERSFEFDPGYFADEPLDDEAVEDELEDEEEEPQDEDEEVLEDEPEDEVDEVDDDEEAVVPEEEEEVVDLCLQEDGTRITPVVREPNAFYFAPYCSFENLYAHSSEIWLGQPNFASVWGQPLNFRITDPKRAMAVAYVSDMLNINPSYLLGLGIKESRMNCGGTTGGCFGVDAASFETVKQNYPEYIDSGDDASLAVSFTHGALYAGLYLYFAKETLIARHDVTGFSSQAKDNEAAVKLFARAYSKGVNDANLAEILGANSYYCQNLPDVLSCFDSDQIALDHATSTTQYCRTVRASNNLYEAQLSWTMLEDFFTEMTDAAYPEGEIDTEALLEEMQPVFDCMRGSQNTISFRYDFNTFLRYWNEKLEQAIGE